MKENLRNDLFLISTLINDNERVLDVGCGDGNLLDYLSKIKKVDCKGIEIKQTGVNECLKKGISVVQGDANYDLENFHDNSFSTVILSQTIQSMIIPDLVIDNLVRIGRRAIISFPNFGYWKIRKNFIFDGLMPKNNIIPYEWYNTPNIHLCSLNDFKVLCKRKKINIEQVFCLNEDGLKVDSSFLINFFAYQAIFSVSKKR